MVMEETRWGAVSPGKEVSIPMIQITFPPFRTKSVHPSVNLPEHSKMRHSQHPFLNSLLRCGYTTHFLTQSLLPWDVSSVSAGHSIKKTSGYPLAKKR